VERAPGLHHCRNTGKSGTTCGSVVASRSAPLESVDHHADHERPHGGPEHHRRQGDEGERETEQAIAQRQPDCRSGVRVDFPSAVVSRAHEPNRLTNSSFLRLFTAHPPQSTFPLSCSHGAYEIPMIAPSGVCILAIVCPQGSVRTSCSRCILWTAAPRSRTRRSLCRRLQTRNTHAGPAGPACVFRV